MPNQIQINSSGGMMARAIMAKTTRRHSSKSAHSLSVFHPHLEALVSKSYFQTRYQSRVSNP